MNEYIERKAAIKAIDDEIYLDKLYKNIEEIPAVDVAPVRHGKWFGTVCTACGESTSFYYDCDYCPQCGAKMDKK